MAEVTGNRGIENSGGEGGIRTPGTGFSPYNGLANRRLQPLGHLSGVYFQQLTTEPSDAPVVKWWLDRREGWKPPSAELSTIPSSPKFSSNCRRSSRACLNSSIR